MECIFCNILKGKIPSKQVYRDENYYAFEDINPQAPVHILVVPVKHIPTVNDLTETDKDLMSEMFLLAKKIAKEKGIAESGYRLVLNCQKDAGQVIYHIHLHIMGGRAMKWPPG